MKQFNKISKHNLNMEDANRILEQAFKAAQAEPNTIPLDVLAANGLFQKRRHTVRMVFIVSAITIFLLLAVLFVSQIPSSFTIKNKMEEDAYNPVYQVDVDSFMLVDKVSASIDGRHIPVYETESHVYSVEPPINGKMEITVTLLNQKSAAQYIDVTMVDKDNPVAESCHREGSLIYLYLSDELSGVDFDHIQTTTLDGKNVEPISVDPSSGCVTFSHLEETVNVYVPDHAGNRLQLILSIS